MKAKSIDLSSRYPESDIQFWNVPAGQVSQIQSKADILLLPVKKGSAKSSIPSKLPAYMFSQKPIIGSIDKDSDTANAILQADCGWIIEPENKPELIKTMQIVADENKTNLKLKGSNGYHYAMEHFSKKNNLMKLVNIIIESQKA